MAQLGVFFVLFFLFFFFFNFLMLDQWVVAHSEGFGI